MGAGQGRGRGREKKSGGSSEMRRDHEQRSQDGFGADQTASSMRVLDVCSKHKRARKDVNQRDARATGGGTPRKACSGPVQDGQRGRSGEPKRGRKRKGRRSVRIAIWVVVSE